MLNRLRVGFLLASVALQNLRRREARTLLLLAGVSICSGAVFTGGVLMRSIDSSMAVGLTRLGADMLVVPEGALTNITAALLTAEPTDLTLDESELARLEAIKGVRQVAPQLVFRTDASGYRGGSDSVDVIALHPARDFTVQPWLEQRLPRPLRKGDVILGGRRAVVVRAASHGLRQARKDRGRHARARPVHDLRDVRRDAPHHAADWGGEGPARTQQAVWRAAPACARRDHTAGALRHFGEFPRHQGRLERIDDHLHPTRAGRLAEWRARAHGNHVPQYCVDARRPVLGDHRRAPARVGPAPSDGSAPPPDHRHAVDGGWPGDRPRGARGSRPRHSPDARVRAFPRLLPGQNWHSVRVARWLDDWLDRGALHRPDIAHRRGGCTLSGLARQWSRALRPHAFGWL